MNEAILSRSCFEIAYRLVRSFSSTPWVAASHYDALGLTPKATQADIKSAYYELSMLHHPDKTGDAESARKFRAITEAYEVLGNLRQKKLYDRGLLVGRENRSRVEYQPDPEPTDPSDKFYKSRMNRHIIPTMDGKTPIYDFDSWAKNHYGETLEKARYDKEILRRKREKVKEAAQSHRQETFVYILFAVVGTVLLLVSQSQPDYDIVENSKNEKKLDKSDSNGK